MALKEIPAPRFARRPNGRLMMLAGRGRSMELSTRPVRSVGSIGVLPLFDAATGTNFAVQERLSVPYTGRVKIRLWFMNSTTAATNVNDCGVAGSTVFDPGINDDGTNPANWQPVADANGVGGTWDVQSGAPAFQVPLATGNAYALNANNDGNINLQSSRWFVCNLPQAVDAPLGWSNLFIRSHAARGFNNYQNRGYLFNLSSKGNYFRRGSEYAQSADFVAANQAGFRPIGGGGGGKLSSLSNVVRIEIIGTKDVESIWIPSDSINQGLFTTGHVNNFLMQWCGENSTPDKCFLPNNLAFAGMPLHMSLQLMRQELAKTVQNGSANRVLMAKPQRILLTPFSNNDPYFLTNGGQGTGPLSASQAHTQFGETMEFADFAESMGVAVDWITKVPYPGNVGASENARLEINQQLRNSGRRVLDADAAVTDGAYPARIRAEFTNDDVHITDPGQAAIKARVTPDLGWI